MELEIEQKKKARGQRRARASSTKSSHRTKGATRKVGVLRRQGPRPALFGWRVVVVSERQVIYGRQSVEQPPMTSPRCFSGACAPASPWRPSWRQVGSLARPFSLLSALSISSLPLGSTGAAAAAGGGVCGARALAFCTTRVSGIMRWLLTSRSSS